MDTAASTPDAYVYRIFGRAVISGRPLPELGPSEGVRFGVGRFTSERIPEDEETAPPRPVRVEFAFDGAPASSKRSPNLASAEDDRLEFVYPGLARIVAGRTILRVELDGAEDVPAVRPLIASVGLGAVWHLRGHLLLHASAVSDDGAVAFLGASGQGKSTTAAAMAMRKFDLWTDDLLLVPDGALEDEPVRIPPGPPAVRLGGDAPTIRESTFARIALEEIPRWTADGEEIGTDRTPASYDTGRKVYYRASRASAAETAPLRRIYLLEEGSDVRIEPVRGRDRVLGLIAHTYAAPIVRSTGRESHQFLQCGALSDRVEVCRLVRPKRPEMLPSLIDRLEEEHGS